MANKLLKRGKPTLQYESQLTPEELAKLREMLLDPNRTLNQVQAEAPRWRSGRNAGKEVSQVKLSRMSKELRRKRILERVEETGKMVEEVKDKIQAEPALAGTTNEALDTICSFLAQEVMEKCLTQEEPDKRIEGVQVLMKRQDQILNQAKFKRETCKLFIKWYEDEEAREILKRRDSNAEKIEALGRLFYGEDW